MPYFQRKLNGTNSMDTWNVTTDASIGGNDFVNVLAQSKARWRYEGHGGDDIITGGRRKDKLFGNDGNDEIWGGRGKNEISGGLGFDTLHGGHHADLIFGNGNNDDISGRTGSDELHGGDGDDTIRGQKGNDTLYGGAGNDRLNGGWQKDILTGGAGADTFIGQKQSVTSPGKMYADIIKDFTVNEDKIKSKNKGLFAKQDGENTLIQFSNTSGSKILFVLEGVTATTLDDDDFVGATTIEIV